MDRFSLVGVWAVKSAQLIKQLQGYLGRFGRKAVIEVRSSGRRPVRVLVFLWTGKPRGDIFPLQQALKGQPLTTAVSNLAVSSETLNLLLRPLPIPSPLSQAAGAEHASPEEGPWRFTLDAPSIFPCMDRMDNQQVMLRGLPFGKRPRVTS